MWQDLCFAWRILWKSPGVTGIVILTPAFRIGANTAVFSAISGTLLRPLPYGDPGRLVDVLDASVEDPNLSKPFGSTAISRSMPGMRAASGRLRFAGLTASGYRANT
jgi:hypothetical protein